MVLKIRSQITAANVKKTVTLQIKNGPANEGGAKTSVLIGD
jgi:hypothetical protein